MDRKPRILSFTSDLLERFCKPSILEGILGDLEESYLENKEIKGAFRTNIIHLFQVLGFLRPRFRKRSKHSNIEAMFKNYLIATVRNLKRHKFYASINIFGLAVGMAAGFMILQYVYQELTYDTFIPDKENIYRVQTNRYNQGELSTQWAAGAAGAGHFLNRDFPEVKEFVNLTQSRAQISYDKKYFELSNPYYAGKNFFKFFSIPLLRGVDSIALKEPMTVALSESLAKKIFGDEDPMGKMIKQNDAYDFKVTAVFPDLPERSHMKFDLLYSFDSFVFFTSEDSRTEWNWDGFLNYVKLHSGVNPHLLAEKFDPWLTELIGEEDQTNFRIELILQPLTKIHLTSNYRAEIKPTGDEKTTYFLLIIGLFVLFIAWINYVNLTTARALSRAKEVGIRKVLGSHRAQLIGQFLFESFFLNVISFTIAALFVVLIFPTFNGFVGKSIPYTWPDAPFFWVGLGLVFLLGLIISGFYPAFVLSNFKPISVLKGKFTSSTSGNNLRRALVTFQFLASVVLITGTFVVYKQMYFLQSQDLGVKIDQTMVIKTPVYQSDSVMSIKDAVFRNFMDSNPTIKDYTTSSAVPGRTPNWNAGGIRLLSQDDSESNQYRILGANANFTEFYGLELVSGRAFDKTFGSEESNVLLNEAAVAQMGFKEAEEAINQKILFWGDTFNIVGVVKNYRQESPKQAYDPLIFRYFPSTSGFYSVKVSSHIADAVDYIQANWEAAFGNKIFDFFFLDDYYNEQYKAEVKFGSIFGLFAALAILVACLGLFGLASYNTSLRSKEVGVRKVLGASIQQLLTLLTWDFVKLVVVSIVIAAPLSWWLMTNWLNNFENRIQLGLAIFLTPAILIVLIAISTVAFHTFKTARLNPADTLHDE
ncbi:MAG: FtsX-like permease family protein [Ekhidna sp.]|uniref:ABC transporter permease n=1 Tax=Ekhidna sp. TaxID=2608089 RepID=UPI0032EC705B